MLGVAVRIAVGAGKRSPAFYMVICAIAAVLITDSIYGWILLHGAYHPGDPLDGGWIVYYVVWGAAALHPSMTTVSQGAGPTVKLTRTRILGIAAAALIADRSRPWSPPPARCLSLEITESLMIDDVELAIERLSALRELGVLVAVDDFGTGYSSLNYIRRLPINILKIDKRFIDSVDGDDRESKLTAAILEMARVLDLRTVAEGVERPEQHARLKALGCDYAQGFLLASPMSPDALLELQAAPVAVG